RCEIAPVGVHRLAEQGHLAATLRGEPLDLVDDDLGRMAALAAPRLGHDAEGAVLLTALHHRDEFPEPSAGRRARRDLDERSLAGLEHRSPLSPAPIDQPGPPSD